MKFEAHAEHWQREAQAIIMALAMQAAPSEHTHTVFKSAWPLPNQLGLSKDFSMKSQTQSPNQLSESAFALELPTPTPTHPPTNTQTV